MMGKSSMERLIDAAVARGDFRCTICGAPAGSCDCWVECSCGWSYRNGQACRNPVHKRVPAPEAQPEKEGT